MDAPLSDRIGRAVNRILDRQELTSNAAARAAYTFALECIADALVERRVRTFSAGDVFAIAPSTWDAIGLEVDRLRAAGLIVKPEP